MNWGQRRRLRGRDTHIYIILTVFALYSRNQHCKSKFSQLKINLKKKNVSRHCHKSPEALKSPAVKNHRSNSRSEELMFREGRSLSGEGRRKIVEELIQPEFDFRGEIQNTGRGNGTEWVRASQPGDQSVN